MVGGYFTKPREPVSEQEEIDADFDAHTVRGKRILGGLLAIGLVALGLFIWWLL